MKTLLKIIIIALILSIPLLLLIISDEKNKGTIHKTPEITLQESSYKNDNADCEEDDSSTKCTENKAAKNESNDLELLTNDSNEYLE